MDQDKITLEVRAHDGGEDVLLSDFNKEVEALARALECADLQLSGQHRRTLEFRVIDLHHSTATVVVGAAPLEGEDDNSAHISEHLFDGLSEILQSARAPNSFNTALVRALRDLASPVGLGVAETLLSWGERSISISTEFKKRVQDVSLPDDVEAGDIHGMMELVNLHNDENRFRLYPIIGPNQINCEFEGTLLETVRAGLGQYVKVSGEFYYRFGEKYPYRITVSSIEIPPHEEELPSFADLRGIAPTLTADASSEETVRKIRDDWQ